MTPGYSTHYSMFSMATALGSTGGCHLQSKKSGTSNGGLVLIFINNGSLGLTDDALDLGSQIGFLSGVSTRQQALCIMLVGMM